MKNILQLVAHPDHARRSFCHQLADRYADGVRSAGNVALRSFLFEEPDLPTLREMLHNNLVDRLCLVYPCWWEMPPAKLVDFLQTTFVKGFAFDYDERQERMVPKIDLKVDIIMTLGQNKIAHVDYLREAMLYCGLTPHFQVCANVGPRMSQEEADLYLNRARLLGENA